MKKVNFVIEHLCNNNCKFCVAADSRHLQNSSCQKIENDLQNYYNKGVRGIVFSGGEPTLRNDLVDIISYASNLGFKSIQIQTNGRLLAEKEIVREFVKAGVTEFSFSLHSHHETIHDLLTNSKESFIETVQAIRNAKSFGVVVMTNTVINNYNYEQLSNIAKFVVKLEVNLFQFAFPHCIGNAAKNFEEIVPYKSKVKNYIHNALDSIKSYNGIMMVEGYPFCFMQGYERFCSELYIPNTILIDDDEVIEDFSEYRKTKCKKKDKKCEVCKYFLICEGPWREYPERRGWEEFFPVEGEKIINLYDLNNLKK